MDYVEVKNWFRQVGTGFIELLYPAAEACPVCRQEPGYGHGIGKKCFQKIGLVAPPICRVCGRPLRLKVGDRGICRQCEENSYYFSEARAVGLYEGALREYLSELKYRYRPELGEALGKLLVDWVRLNPEYRKSDLIIPVPIHRQKLELRGYNQAELLANPLQRYLGIRVKNDIIVRDKLTESQNALSKEGRFANVADAFRVVNSTALPGASVLVVDDILTTGATASEVARMLLRAGALTVRVLTLAVGVIDTTWLEN
ncbi:MAG: ComF family protein [Firmicutes bacterium]|nr:ComF family protein [Bacillota bacterium]